MLGGAIRVSTPFLFVSLGECITERSGRINLGLEGILVTGAMTGYAVSYVSGSPWLGVLAAGGAGLLLGLLHGVICNLPRVNDIAVGIGLMLFGTGLAFFLGKPYVQPKAPTLPAIPFGAWSSSPQIRAALDVNPLFLIGIALAVALGWAFRHTRWGLVVRMVGDSADAARAMGHDVARVRALSTGLGRTPRRDRRIVPVALLPGELERGTVERPGSDGGGARDLRALESAALLLRRAALRGSGRARAGAAVGRIHVGATISSMPRRTSSRSPS